jgi:hypothetical protein
VQREPRGHRQREEAECTALHGGGLVNSSVGRVQGDLGCYPHPRDQPPSPLLPLQSHLGGGKRARFISVCVTGARPTIISEISKRMRRVMSARSLLISGLSFYWAGDCTYTI